MTRSEQEKAVLAAVTSCANEDGWANLADIGTKLREASVKYGKLAKFLASFQDIVEIKQDTDIHPPVAYVRVKTTVEKQE